MVEDKVQCKWCGQATSMTRTEECDSCYELRCRAERNPALAIRVATANMAYRAKIGPILRKLYWIMNYVIEEDFSEQHLDALVRIVGLINDCEEAEREVLEFADALFGRYAE